MFKTIRLIGVALGLATIVAVRAGAQAAQPPQIAAPPKVAVVSVVGCLRESGSNNWLLTNATDPVRSIPTPPPAKELPTAPVVGKNQFKLIGVAEFNLQLHKDHTVVVKGLLIRATPVSRLNVTSVSTAVATCAPAAQ